LAEAVQQAAGSIGEIAFGSTVVAPPKAASSRTDKYSATVRLGVGSRSSTFSTPMRIRHDHAGVDCGGLGEHTTLHKSRKKASGVMNANEPSGTA